MRSYLTSLPDTFTEEQKLVLSDLFEWLVPACLVTIKEIPLNISYSELHLFSCLTRVFSAVTDVAIKVINLQYCALKARKLH